MEALKEKIALTQVKGAGPVVARSLVEHCGGVKEVFKADKSFLLSIPKVTESVVESLADPAIFERAEQELSFIEKNDINPIFFSDEHFPRRLEFCNDAPLLLYTKGNLNLNARKVIAFVGTRSCTAYGKEMCDHLISDLKEYNPLIVSGLAMGIDAAAHKSALKYDLQTVGVLAHGADTIYPPSSRPVASQMFKHGGVVTEFMSSTIPNRENFPTRNRIIAGMCDALIVVESKSRGGSMISADIAYGYNREVYAVPGKATDKLSEGCNNLIKFQKAVMVTSGKDVAREMSWDKSQKKPAAQPELFPTLSSNEKKVLDIIMSNSQIGVDSIMLETGLNSSVLASILLSLEFSGLVRPLPGKTFEAC